MRERDDNLVVVRSYYATCRVSKSKLQHGKDVSHLPISSRFPTYILDYTRIPYYGLIHIHGSKVSKCPLGAGKKVSRGWCAPKRLTLWCLPHLFYWNIIFSSSIRRWSPFLLLSLPIILPAVPYKTLLSFFTSTDDYIYILLYGIYTSILLLSCCCWARCKSIMKNPSTMRKHTAFERYIYNRCIT